MTVSLALMREDKSALPAVEALGQAGESQAPVGNMSNSELSMKWDPCLADTVIKIGTGLD